MTFPGLLPGSIDGQPIHVLDVSHEVGRRLVQTWFPGTDAWAIEDLGVFDGPVTVTFFVVGDDYQLRALGIKASLQRPGPVLYVDPWWGPRLVHVEDGAEVAFSITEHRVARFQATFLPSPGVPAPGLPLPPTLPPLLAAAAAIVADAPGLVLGLLGPLAMATGIVAAVADTAAALAGADGVIAGLLATSPFAADLLPALFEPMAVFADASAIASFVAGPVAGVAGLVTGPLASAGAAVAVISALDTLVAAAPVPALGPGPLPLPALAIPPRAATALMLEVAAGVAAAPVVGHAGRAMALGVEVAALGSAVARASEVVHDSRQAATAFGHLLDGALSRAGGRAEAMLPVSAGAAAELIERVEGLRSVFAADLHEVIGRLPSVTEVRSGGESALLLAHRIVGDDPSAVIPYAADLVRRNALSHPALPPTVLECLL